jgi:two-component system phosphate regulon sensor histidine kinase PhoR
MAIIHNAPRAATVTTTCPTTVLEIQKDSFSKFLERSSSVSIAMVREVSRRLRENDQMAIDDLRLKAQELAVAYQRLAEQENARSEFLTIAAHELRTPLMAANGFVQVIRMGMLRGDALNTALDTVARNLQDIIALTNDILFMQELEMIMPGFQPTDVASVITRAVEQLRSRAADNRIGLRLTLAPGLPLIPGDPKSLERAFISILDNAIKFSPDGGDVVTAVTCDDIHIVVTIEDHGVGIPSDALAHIFDRYFHMENIGGHLFRGIGLGLSVSKAVIEQHGGQITVESSFGSGSRFIVSLKR